MHKFCSIPVVQQSVKQIVANLHQHFLINLAASVDWTELAIVDFDFHIDADYQSLRQSAAKI
jgi:hypothetical protein